MDDLVAGGTLGHIPENVLGDGEIESDARSTRNHEVAEHTYDGVDRHNRDDEDRVGVLDAWDAWKGACLRAYAFRGQRACAHMDPLLVAAFWLRLRRHRLRPFQQDSYRYAYLPLVRSIAFLPLTVATSDEEETKS